MTRDEIMTILPHRENMLLLDDVTAENGTAAKVFENYPMRVGGKTGSSQVSSGTSNGVFAAFAPFDEPEVAVFVIVEHGGSGGNIGIIAREMFDAYFDLSTETRKSSGLNSLGS